MPEVKNWKDRFYDGYISSGQSSADADGKELFSHRKPVYINLINNHFPKDRSSSIIDLGCGHGSFLYFIKKSGYNNCLGIELSKEEVALAHKYGIPEVNHSELQSYLATNQEKYDVILLMDILEHLESQEVINLLDNISARLSPNGRLIMHVPNAEGIFGMRIRYGDFTHENSFTPKSVEQILNITGFENIQVFEDKPPIHGLTSLVRRFLWTLLTFRYRLLLAAETGYLRFILSQSMLVVAYKKQ